AGDDEDGARRLLLEAQPQRLELRERELRGVHVPNPGASRLEAERRPIAVADVARLEPCLAVRRGARDDLAVLDERIPRLDREHGIAVGDDEPGIVDFYRQGA